MVCVLKDRESGPGQNSTQAEGPCARRDGQPSVWRKVDRVKISPSMKRQSSVEALYALLFAACVLLALLLLTA
jgi:hypothetical protein